MSYLFGFSGRINRAKAWLFIIPVTLAWEIAIGLIAYFGLTWMNYLNAMRLYVETSHAGVARAVPPLPWPDPVSGLRWIAVAAIALLFILYVVAYFAIFTKRLHDRNKGAIWLVPFVVVPAALNIFALANTSARPHFALIPTLADLACFVFGLWAIVEIFFLRGTRGENRFGPDPLA